METAKASTRSSKASSFPRSDFDLALTLQSGQVFRWTALGTGSFGGWIDGSFARVSQEGDRLLIRGVSESSARNFFSLDTDLPAILQQIDVDPIIREAIRLYPGLRIIRQDPWECTASFLLSAFNNIPRLTQMLEQLSRRFGTGVMPGQAVPCPRSGLSAPASFGRPSESASLSPRPRSPARIGKQKGKADPAGTMPARPADVPVAASPSRGIGAAKRLIYSFPRPEALASVSERTLRNCGLGYRAPYLKAVAQKLAAGKLDLEKLCHMQDEELRRVLLTLPGIGEKVVECVMLFAYERAAAFPVDVWIGRAMRKWYFRGRKVNDRRIREFAREHFGPHCGWAQQYLYCFARWQSDSPSV